MFIEVLILSFLIQSPQLDRSEILLLTGSVKATQSQQFKTPWTQNWQIQIKWMAPEGSIVEPGDPVIRFDNSSIVATIEQLESQALESQEGITRERTQQNQSVVDAEFAIYEAEIQLKKAQLDLLVPAELVSRYDREQRKLDLAKAEKTLEEKRKKAKESRISMEAKLKQMKLDLGQTIASLERNRQQLERLTMTADRRGTVIYGDNYYEDRKFQPGDMAQIAWTLAEIPSSVGFEIVAWVNEVDLHKCRVDQAATVYFDAYPEHAFPGTVAFISKSNGQRWLWGKGAYFDVSVALDLEPDLDLVPGMSTRVEITIDQNPKGKPVPIERVIFDGRHAKIIGDPDQKTYPILGRNAFYVFVGESP